MKIGVLTFHFGVNFGGVLQCYALQSFLEQQNHTVKIINFMPPNFSYSVWWRGNYFRRSFVFGIESAAIKFLFATSQKNKFNEFRQKYLNIKVLYIRGFVKYQ